MIYDIITWYIIDITLMIYHPNIIYMKNLADIVDHQSDRQGLLEFTAKWGAKELDDQQLEPLFQWMCLDIIGETMFKPHLNIIFPIWNLWKCQFSHHFPHISDRKCRVAGGSNPHPGTRAGLAAARQVSAGLVVGGQYRGGSQVRFFWPKKYAENPNGDYIKIYILHGSIGIYLYQWIYIPI